MVTSSLKLTASQLQHLKRDGWNILSFSVWGRAYFSLVLGSVVSQNDTIIEAGDTLFSKDTCDWNHDDAARCLKEVYYNPLRFVKN